MKISGINPDPLNVKNGINLMYGPYSDHKDKIIRMSSIKKEMTRAQEREEQKNRKYPYAFSYDVTPCKWNSMELIKEITSLLKEMNNSLKNQ